MKPLRVGGLAVLAVAALAIAGPASASATGANFVATGHDMDYHCSTGTTSECEYFKIVVDKVRGGSTLPILAIDHGTEVKQALLDSGYAEAEIATVDPNEATAFSATAFTDGSGNPLYSAIIVASDETCGGCDNNEEGETNINARAADFATFFNHGGGILALAGAERFEAFYNFVPLKVGATVVEEPFTVQPEGLALGVTELMANCCATHNSFTIPAAPFVVLETDSLGKAETIAAFGVAIGAKGFESPPAPTPAPKPAPAPAPVISVLPSKTVVAPKKCTSTRAFTVHWSTSRSGPLSKVVLTLNGKAYKHVSASTHQAQISFAGRGPGAINLKIDGTTASGKHYVSIRTFHPCVAKIEDTNPVTLFLRHH
jgi:hypothetical protein